MKKRGNNMSDERPQYDLRQLLKGAPRGKYAKRYHAGTNVVLLEPDVRKVFSQREGRERDLTPGDRTAQGRAAQDSRQMT